VLVKKKIGKVALRREKAKGFQDLKETGKEKAELLKDPSITRNAKAYRPITYLIVGLMKKTGKKGCTEHFVGLCSAKERVWGEECFQVGDPDGPRGPWNN